jgi:hypothetical protein
MYAMEKLRQSQQQAIETQRKQAAKNESQVYVEK